MVENGTKTSHSFQREIQNPFSKPFPSENEMIEFYINPSTFYWNNNDAISVIAEIIIGVCFVLFHLSPSRDAAVKQSMGVSS